MAPNNDRWPSGTVALPLGLSGIRATARMFLAFVLVVSLSGCQTLSYYSQAVGGQMEVMRAAEPIDQLLRDEATDPALRQRLELVAEIRAFASEDLALPDDGSFRRYADLKRPYVLWNVFAAPAYSLEPVTWCFPIAGCVGYRGYFSEQAAQAFADQMRQDDLDVYVGGVPAYSTLGWFDDVVLNTFINYQDAELARLVFHELAHQVAYAPGDTTFNESFATTVELAGVRRWLAASGRGAQLGAFEAARRRHQDFLDLVSLTREELTAIYASGGSEEQMRQQKASAYSQLGSRYQALKLTWGGFSGYDRWFSDQLNNAKLVSVAAYNQLVPGFERLLDANGGDLAAFYQAVTALTKLSVEERRARLLAEQAACRVCDTGTAPGAATVSLFVAPARTDLHEQSNGAITR